MTRKRLHENGRVRYVIEFLLQCVCDRFLAQNAHVDRMIMNDDYVVSLWIDHIQC